MQKLKQLPLEKPRGSAGVFTSGGSSFKAERLTGTTDHVGCH